MFNVRQCESKQVVRVLGARFNNRHRMLQFLICPGGTWAWVEAEDYNPDYLPASFSVKVRGEKDKAPVTVEIYCITRGEDLMSTHLLYWQDEKWKTVGLDKAEFDAESGPVQP